MKSSNEDVVNGAREILRIMSYIGNYGFEKLIA